MGGCSFGEAIEIAMNKIETVDEVELEDNQVLTTKDLIKILQKLPQDNPILMSKDDEGNGFRYLRNGWVSRCTYDEQEINVGISELTNDLIEHGYSEEDVYENPCIVLG